MEWQRFASSSLGLLMLKFLDENERRWQSIAHEETSHSKTGPSSSSCVRAVTRASVEVTKVCSATDASLSVMSPSIVQSADENDSDTAECNADCGESPNCGNSVPTTHIDSRRGSLPTCDTVPFVSAIQRRNSAPVISHSAAVTVKKYLLATLAEHTSSFGTRTDSTESQHFVLGHQWCAPEASGHKHLTHHSYSGFKHRAVEPQHTLFRKAPGTKKSSWTAVAPLNTNTTCVAIEGRPRDRRSNSHALVFRQCLLTGRIAGRRFSSPAVGQDHWMGRDVESVPLLTTVIPSTSVCSQSALVNWFVAFLCPMS